MITSVIRGMQEKLRLLSIFNRGLYLVLGSGERHSTWNLKHDGYDDTYMTSVQFSITWDITPSPEMIKWRLMMFSYLSTQSRVSELQGPRLLPHPMLPSVGQEGASGDSSHVFYLFSVQFCEDIWCNSYFAIWKVGLLMAI